MTDGTPSYAPGTPLWVDHTSPDVQAAVSFYSDLFGWQAQDMGEEAGHYTMFSSNGKVVAATTPPMSPGNPPAWSTYISTDNVEETARRVDGSGGKTLVAPMQVMDQGSMGVFADPSGAVFAAWQPAAMHGAELVNTAGELLLERAGDARPGGGQGLLLKGVRLGRQVEQDARRRRVRRVAGGWPQYRWWYGHGLDVSAAGAAPLAGVLRGGER